MKATKYSGDEERTILMGLVTSEAILSKVLSGLKSESKPFQSKWSNVVFGWCRSYFQKYNQAPKRSLQSLFRNYSEKHEDEAEVGMIEKFLISLDDEYRNLAKDLNVDFVVDMASKHFNLVRYTRHRDQLDELLLSKDTEQIKEELNKFQPINFGSSAIIDILTDEKAWMEALEQVESDVQIHYPGALGEFFGDQLARDAFVSLMAPEKTGKTWWLIDMAWRALRAKKRVLFISAGDMSRRGLIQRLGIRAARRPIKAGTVMRPKRMILNMQGQPNLKMVEEVYSAPITKKQWRAAQAEILTLTGSKDSLLKLSLHSNGSLNFGGVRGELDELIKSGWIPDVVVLDYMDILAPEDGMKGQDFRHSTNESWKAGRRMSQDYHVCFITATQSDAASYDKKVITRQNFSEDKRKLSHVTGMVGLNQNEEEKKLGLYRLNWVLLREGVYFENQVCYVAGCLSLANPAMKSIW